jgi:hypothetical protein
MTLASMIYFLNIFNTARDVDTFVWFPLKLMKVANKYDNTFYFIM